MPPDLNSLPPSPPSGSTSPRQARLSSTASHTPPHSLAATAAMNAGIHSEESRRSSIGSTRRDPDQARRRSSIRINLNINDPALPAPGELQLSPSLRNRTSISSSSPHHERTPSLGQLHQELENEQEAQVNRLLHMIRQQQAQIAALTASHGNAQSANSSAVDDSTTPTSERSLSLPQSGSASLQNVVGVVPGVSSNIAGSRSRSPNRPLADLSRSSSYRDRSRGNSRTNSPMLRPTSGSLNEGNEWLLGQPAGRDESAFYQAETQMLTRENQMLKMRIRELERQLADFNPSPVTHTPTTASNLHTSPPVAADAVSPSGEQHQASASATTPNGDDGPGSAR